MTASSVLRLNEKILPREEVLRRYGRPRTGRVVFTNGCFDLLHRGHVEYLNYAASLGDQLVLALNSDRSVRALKGEGRPLNPAEDRAVVLAGLAAVDVVTIFDEETPQELIAALLPDILVKGADYAADEVVGGPEVIAAGGKVVLAPLLPGRSTTRILEKTLGMGA